MLDFADSSFLLPCMIMFVHLRSSCETLMSFVSMMVFVMVVFLLILFSMFTMMPMLVMVAMPFVFMLVIVLAHS